MREIKGYKVFHEDWTCRGMKFEVGKVYEEDVVPECRKRGIHFCPNLRDCFAYYEFSSKNKVTEVVALGNVDFDLKNKKYCTNKIKIVRELDWQEVMDLLDIKKGYKVFHEDWNFKGIKFEVGKIYQEDVTPKYCERGFHYCLNLLDCLDYYIVGKEKEYHIAEVAALGDIDFYSLGERCCTNQLKVVQELNWLQVLNIINAGKYNTGQGNTGQRNTGEGNIGNCNIGNCNRGYGNTGNYNQGDSNVGNYNASSFNVGNYNTSILGGNNTGDYNVGDRNTGDYNVGYRNAGDCNVGFFNTGNQNEGSCNTGMYNIGNYNTGDCNKTNFSSGCFNTIEPKIDLFNKPSDWTHKIWQNSKANKILSRISLTEWIPKEAMTAEERQDHKEYAVTGGYLKYYNFKEACQIWWNSLTDREKRIIQWIPNFDAAIFYEITGIDVKQ